MLYSIVKYVACSNESPHSDAFYEYSQHQGSHTSFWDGAGANGIGKISILSTTIGKIYIEFMHEVSIARLIPILNLTMFLDI